MSDTPTPAPAEQNTDPAGDSGAAASGPARETDNATMAELRILRKQLKDANQRLSAADQAAAEKAKAEMTELERYKSEAEQYRKQAEDTQSRFLETQKHNAIKLAAVQAGAVDVEDVLKLADLSTVDLEGDKVIGVDAALKALQKAKPYLFGTPKSAPTGSGGGNPRDGAPKDLTVETLRSANRDQFAEIARARGDKHFPR